MRIKCPVCNSILSIRQPKPGSYQPKCRDCGKAFRLKITDEHPPSVRIGRISSAPPTIGAIGQTIQQSSPIEPKPTLDHLPSDVQPDQLGGYRILRLLGRGAMGAVYEAKQLSLDRMVALKTIRGRLADNPASLARFTREAYAAAQLNHHNVVQIYDFGEDQGQCFFSMEWVRGGGLDELIRAKGSLDPKLAAGYILQAARGLQFAHRNGMVHRDIKPANLLLSDEGVIKVADLGLVKIPDQVDLESDLAEPGRVSGLQSGTQVTMQGTAVGTPAYMAPEQSADATAVDHRADIYSLGCTLFYLLAGKPPFGGTVVSEVMQQHATQPLPSLMEVNRRVPESLQQIVQRSMAKRPDDRYAAIAEMIVDLESYLGLQSGGKFSPSCEQADHWETIANNFSAASPQARWTVPLTATLVGVSLLITVVIPVLSFRWILTGPSLLVAAVTTATLLTASPRRSPLIERFRQWFGSLSWIDCGIGIAGAFVCLLAILFSGLWIGLIGGLILGLIAGAAYHFLLMAPMQQSLAPVIANAQRFVRDLRIEGTDEVELRLFTARYGGKHWQPLVESIFGYDALCATRNLLSKDRSFSGPVYAGSLRDRLCNMLANRAIANRRSTDRRRLAKIEQRGLQSEGMNPVEARDRAWQMAAAVIDHSKVVAPPNDAEIAAQQKRQRIKAMLAEARSGKYKKKRDPTAPVRLLFGGPTRLLAGSLILVWFVIGGRNGQLFDAIQPIDFSSRHQISSAILEIIVAHGRLVSQGIAGMLLCMSAFVSGWRMTPFAAIATAIICWGPSCGIPGIGESIQPWMTAVAAGLIVYLPGIVFGETKDDQ